MNTKHGGVAQLEEAHLAPPQYQTLAPASAFTAERQIEGSGQQSLDGGSIPPWPA
jgi:hypothetical protein